MNKLTSVEIICTIGPSSLSNDTLLAFEELGVNLLRINLSHTKVDELADTIEYVKSISSIPICIDTEGAQIRTGPLSNSNISLNINNVIDIPAKRVMGTKDQINLYPEGIINDLEIGDLIKVDFGEVVWQIKSKNEQGLIVRVLVGGSIGPNKAVTVDRDIVLPVLTNKDRECLDIGLELGLRNFAISFVNRSYDLDMVREIVGHESHIMSKIECINGVKNFDSIAVKSDSLLIDRGDLSREVMIERIPQLQKDLIQRAKQIDTKIYVATNLLESMVSSAVPTRAEVNDIYNTLNDGVSGLVLAAETAIGSYPKRCVQMVNKVIKQYMNRSSIHVQLDRSLNSSVSSTLMEPHGGSLVNRLNHKLEADKIVNKIISVDYSVMSTVEQIAIGSFSPLEGFMIKSEVETVLDEYRMPSGIIWPLPIMLQVKENDLAGIRIGDVLGLTLVGTNEIQAVLYLNEIYKYDLDELALRIYGTNNDAHPGVQILGNNDEYFLGGKIDLVSRNPSSYRYCDLTPIQSRQIFESRGWRNVVGFHTRNVVHRVHEFIQLNALEQYNCDGIFLHPVIGRKKSGDYNADIIMKSYELMVRQHYPQDKVLLSPFHYYSQYAGPREAVFSALCRKNFGCSHFIVGRDHTGVGQYYMPDESQKLFKSLGNIGIKPIFYGEINYCNMCKQYLENCVHADAAISNISGTEARKMFQMGSVPPDWFMRPEISELVLEEIKLGLSVFVE
jgi:ATP sulfurylase